MPAYRDHRDGRWRYRKVIRLPDGTRVPLRGTPPVNSKVAAEAAERDAIDLALHPPPAPEPPKEVPTFKDWFDDRFWKEWVVAQGNRPSERAAKRSIFEQYLDPELGALRLDAIGVQHVNALKAHLQELKRGPKRINNVLAVLSKALRYAEEAGVIEDAPRIRLSRTQRAEIEWWEFEQYERLLAAADVPLWYAGIALAGEGGLRVGEVRGVMWEDVDLVAKTVTVNRQIWRGQVGPPKGGRSRVVELTPTLEQSLRALAVVRRGYVLLDRDGEPFTERQMARALYRVCRLAGLPESGWHRLRHTMGTHAAQLGANPWWLQARLGHRRIDETMMYVHVAEAHRRPVPEHILESGRAELDPTRRMLLMLGSRKRCNVVATSARRSSK